VVGIDNVASAIQDAGANAALNGITNATFVCGAAEKVLSSVLQVGVLCVLCEVCLLFVGQQKRCWARCCRWVCCVRCLTPT
jgi:hypothetical protein